MTIDVGVLASRITEISVVVGVVVTLIRQINKLLKRLSVLEKWTRSQQRDIEFSKNERRILLKGTLACLKGLQEQGCNGPVEKAIMEIEKFILHEAHRGSSHESED